MSSTFLINIRIYELLVPEYQELLQDDINNFISITSAGELIFEVYE